ncbi:MAG: tRNA (adenine(22)-N(1))-methyltransferase [Lachnospiraceae bacterium]
MSLQNTTNNEVEQIKLSERMLALAKLVRHGNILADIGTDHAYIPIYLVRSNWIPKAIAMDIGRGPLDRAQAHITQYHCEERIETRLSDGLDRVEVGEVDTILMAGMGGGLILQILMEGQEICQNADEIILQPQSEIEKVRRYLYENGYMIDREDMVLEDGKYYPMMHIKPDDLEHAMEWVDETARELVFRFGPCLLADRNEVLHSYLMKHLSISEHILEQLNMANDTGKKPVRQRIREVETERSYLKMALAFWEDME